ncbi:MAG: glycosyl hydrolase, partial [Acidithiobacillus sp.]
ANSAKRCHLDNGNLPNEPGLSESEKADTVGFLGEMLRILPLLGVHVFAQPKPVIPGEPDMEVETPPDERDTVVVPAQEEGFQQVFLGQDCWYAIRIGGGMLGKIGVTVSPAQSNRVWVLVECEKSGLYRSDDGGDTWQLISPNRDLLHRPWYYTHVFADSTHSDTVYVTNFDMWKSTNGGKDFHEVTTPHGDNHDLWIDPVNNQRMVQGNDGGANVSFNGGETWSTIYNQPTAQIYRMDIDNQFPYRVYGTQQDNTSISVPSAAEWGVITMADCTIPGTGESGFITVHPEDPNIVYVGCVGSSPGGNGALQRYDHSTRQARLVNVWPEQQTGVPQRELKYRFAWTFPIVFSPHDPKTLYAGGNHLFRTRNEGQSWEAISPDLSRNDPEKLGSSGGPLTGDGASAEAYASLATFAESPHRPGELWAGTDDGLVHSSKDGGQNWRNVTPKAMPDLAYVGTVEISPDDADTIYLTATCYKLDDYEPYLFQSKDGGKSWQSIVGDFPAGEITRVLRADPVRAGLLFVGTETGVFYTLNDGRNWMRMQGGIPVVPVYDLKIKDSDLVAATHGRSFWILDDITPLRKISANKRKKGDLVLFKPRPTYRLKLQWAAGMIFTGDGKAYGPAFGLPGTTYPVKLADGTTERRHLDAGENPPAGAIIYYWLDNPPEDGLALSIRDAKGNTIAQFSDDESQDPNQRLTKHKGMNRFIWNIRYPAPEKLDPDLVERSYEPLSKSDIFSKDGGPTAPPGDYSVKLECGGSSQDASFELCKDPRVETTQTDFDEQFTLVQSLTAKLSDLRSSVNRIRRMKNQLRELSSRLPIKRRALVTQANKLVTRLEAIEGALINVHRETPRDILRHTAGLDDTLGDLISIVAIADFAPTDQAKEVAKETVVQVDRQIAKLDKLIDGSIAALNEKIVIAGISTIGA